MTQPVITFTIAPGLPREAEDAIVTAVGYVDGVEASRRIAPESGVGEIQRMGIAFLISGPNAPNPEAVVDAIRALPGIESADMPPDRAPLQLRRAEKGSSAVASGLGAGTGDPEPGKPERPGAAQRLNGDPRDLIRAMLAKGIHPRSRFFCPGCRSSWCRETIDLRYREAHACRTVGNPATGETIALAGTPKFCAFLRPEIRLSERRHGNADPPRLPILTMDFVPVPEPKTVTNRIH